MSDEFPPRTSRRLRRLFAVTRSGSATRVVWAWPLGLALAGALGVVMFVGSQMFSPTRRLQQVSVIGSPHDGYADFAVWRPMSDRPLPQRDTLVCAFWKNGKVLIGFSGFGLKPGELLAGTVTPEVASRLVDQLITELGSERQHHDRVALDTPEVLVYALRNEQQWSLIGPASALYPEGTASHPATATERIIQSALDECSKLDLSKASKIDWWHDGTGFDQGVCNIEEWP